MSTSASRRDREHHPLVSEPACLREPDLGSEPKRRTYRQSKRANVMEGTEQHERVMGAESTAFQERAIEEERADEIERAVLLESTGKLRASRRRDSTDKRSEPQMLREPCRESEPT